VVREIEAETYEENPPLFREYISAAPDVKFIMDNQFKNIRTNARLLSKAMWYEWRMKLLEGLKEGLYKIKHDMIADEGFFARQETLISSALLPLIEQHSARQQQQKELEVAAEELANCDQEQLNHARQNLLTDDAIEIGIGSWRVV